MPLPGIPLRGDGAPACTQPAASALVECLAVFDLLASVPRGILPGAHLRPLACTWQSLPDAGFLALEQTIFRVLGPFPRPFPNRFPTLLGKTFPNKINKLLHYFGLFPNSPAFWKTRGEVEHENSGKRRFGRVRIYRAMRCPPGQMAPSPPSRPRRRLVEILASPDPLRLPDALVRLTPRHSSWCSPEGPNGRANRCKNRGKNRYSTERKSVEYQ